MPLALLTLFSAWSSVAGIAADGAAPERFRVIERHCRLDRDGWRQLVFGDLRLIGVQPIAMPGRDTCALLVWRRTDDVVVAADEADNEADADGAVPFSSRCDTPAELVWNDHGTQRTFPIPGSDYVTGARAVLDTRDGTPLLLVGTTGPNRCSIQETVLLSWMADEAAPLQLVDAGSEVARAHAGVCPDLWARDVCTPEDGNEFVASFIDLHWSDEHEAFDAALQADDRPALSALRARGLPPYWIGRAIDAVSSDTTASLAQRRRRTAWLFRDEHLADALTTGVALGLLPWLPAEDWTPVLNALKNDTKLLRLLHAEAERGGYAATGCRIARALGTPEGKTEPPCKKVE